MNSIIQVSQLSKKFRIPLDQSTTLKYRLVHWRTASRFREFQALEDVSFEVKPGEFLGVIGANGSGKSTLLKLLAKILVPTSGSIAVNGPVSSFLELGVGFNPELTARENVMLNGAVLGLTRSELRARMAEILEFAELDHKADQKVKNFSSGQEVRLAFSIAIQADAEVLLMDEVLAVGDARFQQKCFDAFARYKREGKTVILVTHDLGAVEYHCDRALLLEDGRVVADGGASDVVSQYRRLVGEQMEMDTPETIEPVALDEGSRWGSGEIKIAEVRFLDKAGESHYTFTSGDSFTLEIDLKVVTPVDDLVCGFAIYRTDGLPVAGTNTFIAGETLHCPPAGESVTLRYHVDNLSLLADKYQLSIAVHARASKHIYDHHERAYGFAVVDESGRIGLFELNGKWEIDEAAGTESDYEAAPRTKSIGA